MVVETLTLALMLAGASIGVGQTQTQPPPGITLTTPDSAKAKPAPKKSKLEEMLAEALRSNPDIRVAAANVALADAELNRTRLQVTQKVMSLHASLGAQKAEVAFRQTQYERFKKLAEQGSIDSKLVDEQQQRLMLAKAKLAELEAQMPALLGKTPTAYVRRLSMTFAPDGQTVGIGDSASIRLWDASTGKEITAFNGWTVGLRLSKSGPMAERIRKALETPVKASYKNMKLLEVFKDLEKKAPGLSLRYGSNIENIGVDMRFEEALPVSAILQAFADDFHLLFVVRDYGILVVNLGQAKPPPGAMTVEEFLRQKPADEPPGNIGLFKDKPTLNWPQSLRGEAFKEAREDFNRQMKHAANTVQANRSPDESTINDLQADLKKLSATLEANVGRLSPDQYVEAKRYLGLLNNAVTSLKSRQPKEEAKPHR